MVALTHWFDSLLLSGLEEVLQEQFAKYFVELNLEDI
jgi:hypothetical protein